MKNYFVAFWFRITSDISLFPAHSDARNPIFEDSFIFISNSEVKIGIQFNFYEKNRSTKSVSLINYSLDTKV